MGKVYRRLRKGLRKSLRWVLTGGVSDTTRRRKQLKAQLAAVLTRAPQTGASFDDPQYWNRLLARWQAEQKIAASEGRMHYFSESMPPAPPPKPSLEWLVATAQSLAALFADLGPFYLHVGGAGDALLLLATFLDQHPDAQIVSFPNSLPAARSFFEAFPSLQRVWFLPRNENPEIHLLLRMMIRHVPNCQGVGVTPEIEYAGEWNAQLDIFQHRGVARRPIWAKQFRNQPQPRQVVLAPQGSLHNMSGSKRNIIDPAVWPDLLRLVQSAGFTPVVIGTPDESPLYPCPVGGEDRRSYSFREQMELIANSALLIAADSWAKTFAALAGVSAIVFDPLKGADWNGKKDASDFVFIHPWDSISVVKNLDQCRGAFTRLTAAPPPAPAETAAGLLPPTRTPSPKGSFGSV